MSITITQIAKLAGVSRGTVDRVIHQRGRVAPEVEKRIRDIMDENDYHPNMLERALAVSKTPLTIGMIMIEKGNPFFQLIHSGMKEAISQFRDYPISVDFRHINLSLIHIYLRSLFGMVLQDTWLFNGTIKENLMYGKLDASDEEVKNACEMAYVDHFVNTLEDGYDTVLDEETSNISQGQKQLLTIADVYKRQTSYSWCDCQ